MKSENRFRLSSQVLQILVFLPLFVRVLVKIQLLPLQYQTPANILGLAALSLWSVVEIWRGIKQKAEGKLALGIFLLAFFILGLIAFTETIQRNIFLFLGFTAAMVSWLIEWLAAKAWRY